MDRPRCFGCIRRADRSDTIAFHLGFSALTGGCGAFLWAGKDLWTFHGVEQALDAQAADDIKERGRSYITFQVTHLLEIVAPAAHIPLCGVRVAALPAPARRRSTAASRCV